MNLAVALLAMLLVMATSASSQTQSQTRTINLNTGFDQANSTRMAVGQPDNEWRVMQSTPNNPPPPPPATGRPADVVSDADWADFHPSGSGTYVNSRWISINTSRQPSAPPSSYQYAFYFTLPSGFSSAQLTMDLNADDRIASVTLNSCSLPTNQGGIFNGAPLHILSQAGCFVSGPSVNVITVTVQDTRAVITGLIVSGTVTYQDCDRSPIRDIPGLTSITFWESTVAAPTQHTFAKGGPELTTRLNGPLSSSNKDFEGVQGAEFYDIFYSGWNGTPDPNGQFVTIEAEWNVGAPSGGGLNIARVDFNGTGQFANSVASFVVLGNNAMPNDVGKAVDGLTSTDTTMGNTIGQTQRLRITVGFPCPDPVDTTCIRVQVFEPHFPNPPHGPPAVNSHVTATGVSYSGSSDGYTDSNGFVCLLVKRNSQVSLQAFSNQVSSYVSVPIVITTPNIASGPNDCGNLARCPLQEIDLDIIVGGLRRGMNEFCIWGGGGPFHSQTPIYNANSGVPIDNTGGVRFGAIGLCYGRILSTNDRFAFKYTFNANPVAVLSYPDVNFNVDQPFLFSQTRRNVFGAGLSPIGFQLYFRSQSRIKPFVSTSGGFIFFKDPVPRLNGAQFNFTYDFGGGVQVFRDSKRAFTLGYKYQRISNGGRALNNPGFDGHVFYFGYSIFKARKIAQGP